MTFSETNIENTGDSIPVPPIRSEGKIIPDQLCDDAVVPVYTEGITRYPKNSPVGARDVNEASLRPQYGIDAMNKSQIDKAAIAASAEAFAADFARQAAAALRVIENSGRPPEPDHDKRSHPVTKPIDPIVAYRDRTMEHRKRYPQAHPHKADY